MSSTSDSETSALTAAPAQQEQLRQEQSQHADATTTDHASAGAVDNPPLASAPLETAPTATPSPVQSSTNNTPSVASSTTTDASTTRRSSLEARSATFSTSTSPGVSAAMLWRNKSVSCETIRAFETRRRAQIDAFQDKDRAYWRQFEAEVLRAKDENARLQKFFAMRLQADLAYADALRRIRHVVEKPAATHPSMPSSSLSPTALPAAVERVATSARALNTIGENQQQQAEKLVQFTTVVRRDVMSKPLEEMVVNYTERAAVLLTDGNRLDQQLLDAQQRVRDAFQAFDVTFRDMERLRASANSTAGARDVESSQNDLWLAELAYSVSVHRLEATRNAYVTGMATLFQQFKALEVVRVAVVQTALDTFIRKQKLLFDELAGGLSEPMAAVHRIDPERDLLHSVRRIPKNFTAAALAADDANHELSLFRSLRSPLASPLLVRCGFLKLCVVGPLFRTLRDVLGAVTQDGNLHVIELNEKATQAIAASHDAVLAALAVASATSVTFATIATIATTTVHLVRCRVEILATASDAPSFELTEVTQPTSLFSSMFRLESTRKLTFQCASQSDLLDWVVAAKRFVAPGGSSNSSTATPVAAAVEAGRSSN